MKIMYKINLLFIFVIIFSEIILIALQSDISTIIAFPVSLLFVISNMLFYRIISLRKWCK